METNAKLLSNESNLSKNEAAWIRLFDKYDIFSKVEKNGVFEITASQIKEFREPRLMTKFDTEESLPKCFGKGNGKKLSILPNSRGSYVMGYFDSYHAIPEMERFIKHIDFPEHLETISKENINSEANVINVLGVTSVLDDFLGEKQMVQTISGRMKSGEFEFVIQNTKNQGQALISVRNAQIEIDAGFENHNCVSIIEAKNVVHKDFIVRQLYYPFRLWKTKLVKEIRPVFLVYSNNIFRLMEFEFTDVENYSSIKFVRQKNYSFEDVDITMDDLTEVYNSTRSKEENDGIPFIQADSFPTVISLLELLKEEDKTISEIAEAIGFDKRQGDYYFNAARYLELTEKYKAENGIVRVRLSALGEAIMKMPYKKRQLKYVEQMFTHEIFRYIFMFFRQQGEAPDKKLIASKIRELNLCGESLVERRASSVSGWIKWLLATINN